MFEENEISKNAQGGTEIAKRMLQASLDPSLLENFQIISSRIRELDPTKIRILFCHDLAQDPEVKQLADHNYRAKFHKFVFISNWQYQQFQMMLGIPYDNKSVVIESGINPSYAKWDDKPNDRINFVYTSTPQRGLNILNPVFSKLAETYDNIYLDVFSSFKIYGWEEQDKQFEPLYQQTRDIKNATYHGFAPHEEILKHLENVHVFAYPSVWQETSCRAMLEAMSAQCICVHPNLAGLPDSSGGLNIMYQGDTNIQQHANMFHSQLDMVVRMINDGVQENHLKNRLLFNQNYVNGRYSIQKIKHNWESLLKGLVQQYPDESSRNFEGDTFAYRF